MGMREAIRRKSKAGDKSVRPTWQSLFRGPTAVDQNVSPGNESRRVRTEIASQCTNLFHLAPSSDGQIGKKLCTGLGIIQHRSVHLRGKRAGTDAIDGNSLAS